MIVLLLGLGLDGTLDMFEDEIEGIQERGLYRDPLGAVLWEDLQNMVAYKGTIRWPMKCLKVRRRRHAR